jgi:hypothetical protein
MIAPDSSPTSTKPNTTPLAMNRPRDRLCSRSAWDRAESSDVGFTDVEWVLVESPSAGCCAVARRKERPEITSVKLVMELIAERPGAPEFRQER